MTESLEDERSVTPEDEDFVLDTPEKIFIRGDFRNSVIAGDFPSKSHPKKRERAKNFTETEKEHLLSIVEKYTHIIENKRTDAISAQSKIRAWNEIAEEFNINAITGLRTGTQLKLLYENLKKMAKKHKVESSKTVGTTHESSLTTKVLSLLGTKVGVHVYTNNDFSFHERDSDIKPRLLKTIPHSDDVDEESAKAEAESVLDSAETVQSFSSGPDVVTSEPDQIRERSFVERINHLKERQEQAKLDILSIIMKREQCELEIKQQELKIQNYELEIKKTDLELRKKQLAKEGK